MCVCVCVQNTLVIAVRKDVTAAATVLKDSATASLDTQAGIANTVSTQYIFRLVLFVQLVIAESAS